MDINKDELIFKLFKYDCPETFNEEFNVELFNIELLETYNRLLLIVLTYDIFLTFKLLFIVVLFNIVCPEINNEFPDILFKYEFPEINKFEFIDTLFNKDILEIFKLFSETLPIKLVGPAIIKFEFNVIPCKYVVPDTYIFDNIVELLFIIPILLIYKFELIVVLYNDNLLDKFKSDKLVTEL